MVNLSSEEIEAVKALIHKRVDTLERRLELLDKKKNGVFKTKFKEETDGYAEYETLKEIKNLKRVDREMDTWF